MSPRNARMALFASAIAFLGLEGYAVRLNCRLVGWPSAIFIGAALTWNLAAFRLPAAPWLVALAALVSGAVDGTILSIWSYLHLTLLPLGPLTAIAAAGSLTPRRVALVAVAFAAGFAVVYPARAGSVSAGRSARRARQCPVSSRNNASAHWRASRRAPRTTSDHAAFLLCT